MQNNRPIVLPILLALGLLACGTMLPGSGRAGTPPEPVYQGKSLGAWLQPLYSSPPSSEMTNTPYAVAVRNLGTNAVPYFVAMLRARDSVVSAQYKSFAMKLETNVHYAYQGHYLALWGLAVLGPAATSAIPAVAEHLTDPMQSYNAAHTLSQIGTSSIPVLATALTNRDKWVTAYALMSLALLHDEQAFPVALASVNDSHPGLAREAVTALGSFPNHAATAVPVLTGVLNGTNRNLRVLAARALGNMGAAGKAAFPGLLKSIATSDDGERCVAAQVMMQIDADAAFTALTNNVASTDAKVRRGTIRALGLARVGGTRAWPALAPCLQDPDSGVRVAAAESLGTIGADPVVVTPLLAAALADTNLTVCVKAAGALAEFGAAAKPAVPAIVKLMDQCWKQADEKLECLQAGMDLNNALAKIDPAAATDWEKAHRN